jgi:hypothetical protein
MDPNLLQAWTFLQSSAIQAVHGLLAQSAEFMPLAVVVRSDGALDFVASQEVGAESTAATQVTSIRRMLADYAASGQIIAAAIVSRVRRQVPLPDGTVDGVLIEMEFRGVGAVAFGYALRWDGSHPQLGDAWAVAQPSQLFGYEPRLIIP